ncbi:MAG: DMT family transporter [Kofleriaceae bacterium]
MVVLLVLASAFLHALWNAQLRREVNRDRALVAAVGIAALLSAIFAVITGGTPFPTVMSLVWSGIAGILELIYFVTLARALDRGPLGSVYTVTRGGAMILAWPVAVALQGEGVTAGSIAGTALVLIGVILSGGGLTLPRAALGWSITCAIAIAGYHLAYKEALSNGGVAPAVFAVSLGVATLVNLVRVGPSAVRAVNPRIALMGAVCAASFLLLLDALASGGTGVVLTTRNTSVLFAVILAAAIGDRPTRRQVVGAIFVAAGAIAMS